MMDLYKMERELIEDEGWRSKPYLCSAGHWTIGVGHKMTPYELKGRLRDMEWDSDKIFTTLRQDLVMAIAGCEMIFGRTRFELFSENRQRSLVNMCFQMGTDGLSRFKRLVHAIFRDDWTQAHAEALDSKWARTDSPTRAKRVAARLLQG
jgi:lysozyme